MAKYNQLCCTVLAGLLIAGCADESINAKLQNQSVKAYNTSAADDRLAKKGIKTAGWRIQAGCSNVTEELAEAVYQEVLELKQELSEGIYEMKNSRMIFLREEVKGDGVEARAVFEADYTGVRKPEDHPMIQGMYEARAELKTDKDRKAADEYIDGWLKELYPEYQKTERYSLEVAVKFKTDHTKEYKLYYPFVKNSKEKLKPLRKYAEKNWKEDKEQRHQMGRTRLFEYVELSHE